jgi:hypothetical protein
MQRLLLTACLASQQERAYAGGMRTKTDAEMADAEREWAENDPERADMLARARRFKSSWLELAEALTRVRRSGQWQKWGYETFEAYAKTELHLRPETVEKLTGSFAFLQRRAPEVLIRDGMKRSIPSYQSVDFLRRAEESEGAPPSVVEGIRKRVLEEAAPVPREMKEQVFPIDEATRKQRDVAALKNVATRLRELLGETRVVPRKTASEVATALDQLLEALAEKEEAAA